jgi:hypothetical protein
VLLPREQPCEFQFPEDIAVPSLPGPEAENQGARSPSQGNPGDFERGEEVEQSPVLVGPEEEPEGRDPVGPSVREEKSKDPRSGGAQESAPREEPSQEGGWEEDH